jgi:hypothetical protein
VKLKLPATGEAGGNRGLFNSKFSSGRLSSREDISEDQIAIGYVTSYFLLIIPNISR